ncbi:hypothetical protein [Actinoallomurus iriomotensis]|uniref:Uncharacterized protein n=1 Tax=Actinoallomurus iriomotensis TaxID=478107 RepID=A0A9W6RS62_9ACTN|nr:hypothetical protein [Actinoallomurus iriomotensis]GLY80793.1 hypothetical protein Airi01_090600 [Actinoallomurus iriomotensis]
MALPLGEGQARRGTGAHHRTAGQDQREILADPALRRLFLEYDHTYDLDAGDPRIDGLARRVAEASRERYGAGGPPRLDAASEIPVLIQGMVNAASPAWRRLDTLIRDAMLGETRGDGSEFVE